MWKTAYRMSLDAKRIWSLPRVSEEMSTGEAVWSQVNKHGMKETDSLISIYMYRLISATQHIVFQWFICLLPLVLNEEAIRAEWEAHLYWMGGQSALNDNQ